MRFENYFLGGLVTLAVILAAVVWVMVATFFKGLMS